MSNGNDKHALSPAHLHLGHAVRHMRRKKRMSRLRLARACAMRWSDLGRLERGRYDPDLHVMRRISFALGGMLGTLMFQLSNAEYIADFGGERALRRAAEAHLSATKDDGTISPLPLR